MKCAAPTAAPSQVTLVFTCDAEGRLSAACPAGEPQPPGLAPADAASPPGPYLYTSQGYDSDASFECHAVRSFDPAPGRWTALDPAACAGGDPNVYRCVAG
jgi:hypothetical protein